MKSVHAATLAILALASPMAGPAAAQDWATRAGDERLSAGELQAFLTAGAIRFYDGGRSEYGPGSSYAYVYADDGRAEGRYRIGKDGAVCVDFANGFSRCDLFVRNAGRMVLIDRKGARFPVKP